jgi:PAS domain S-box-containing protein
VGDLSSYAFSPLRDGDFALYRGSGKGLRPILLVTVENASPAWLNRLEHEYALRADLDAAWAAHPIELSRHRNRLALVLEDPGGEVLDRLLGQPLGITEFLRIGISLAWALRQVHARGLFHKDIKPANILVDVGSGVVWLTGFGIASRLPRERLGPEPPYEIAGTLAYMAPEQTGRMNRSIDARSDLYSLGVTFYEMLTGTLPFTATDPMEWVHCHIARQPVPPDERTLAIPGALSVLTMKLLAKTAEERYQTAAGVETDLRRCLAEWESQGRIDPFPLGAHDASDRLLIPEQLYGREREIETLLACFDRVVAYGTPELVLVSGYSGIGKSSVVHELHKVLVQPRGLYASGKFDQYKRDIPYVTLAQAFQSLVRSLLSQDEGELGRWRDSFSEALGSNGQLIVNLVPELELIIGQQPTVPDLPPQDAKNRFQSVFRRFLGVFARKEHPLALFLDDLQWLDIATLDLLEHLVTHSEVRHLLLVGAYRDNEVGPSHPLIRALEAIRETDATVREIVLLPLGIGDLGRLIADALHCDPERAQTLAELVGEKTGGNPFFAIQFLIALVDEGLLAFDSVAGVWVWDIGRIHGKNYADNVVELMVRKLKRLSITTQDALKHLACLGNMAEISTLSVAYEQTEEAMHAALWEAVRDGLVVHQASNYKFLHDRIQQAAYSLFPEKRRAAVHLRIGRRLLANLTAEEITEQLFEVANQFNRGGTLIVDWDEKSQVATINLRAGRKAKASAAYASARAYFAAGMMLLDEWDWGSQYDLTFNLWLERAQCEFLSGNFEEAEQLIGELLQRAASKVDQAAVYLLKVRLHTVKGEYPQAADNARTCLRLFGIDLPAHPSWEEVHAEYEAVWRNLNGRSIESLIDLPLMTDPEMQVAMQVCSILAEVSYFTDFYLYCMLVCRMGNISVQQGMSGASAHAYACLGSILGPAFHRYPEGYRLGGLACDLVEKHGFTAYRTKVYHDMGAVSVWTQPITSMIELRRATTRTATETGDLTYACYSMHQTITGFLLRNDPLDAVWRESEMALDFARTAQFRDVVDLIVSQQRFIAAMQGRTAAFSTFSDVRFDEAAFEAQLTGDRMNTMICLYWILKLKARFLSGDYAEALAAAEQVKPVLGGAAGQAYLLDYSYYAALTVAALYENATADEQAGWRILLIAHREQLHEWADNYPPTFGDKHALVSAEIARLEGRDADAMRLYEQAINSAREHGFVQNEGLAHEVAADFYAACGVESIAYTYLRNARDCYLRWGALGKVRQLDQRHPGLREEPAATAPSATVSAPVEHLDVGTVVKSSQAVSGEIELGKLIETLMRIAVQHAGAERGLLILFTDNEPRIAAEATTGRGNIEVMLRDSAVTPTELIEPVLHTVIRTRESVILDDASTQNSFSADEYIRNTHARSVLCLPLLKQAKLIGVLYLENNLTPHAFTSARLAVLNLLASQAAISLENARLYADLSLENSERKQAEEALKQGQKRFRAMVEKSVEGIVLGTPEKGVIYASPSVERVLGYTPEEFVGRLLYGAVHLNHRQHMADIVAELLVEPHKVVIDEVMLLHKDRSWRWIECTMRNLLHEPSVQALVINFRDITERKLAQAEREQLEQRLRQAEKMESLGRLAAGIAHDFNNVLAGVFAYGEMLFEATPEDSPLKRYAKNVLTAATRGRSLIDQILAYSRSQLGKRAPIDIGPVVAETLELLRGSLPATLRLEASVPPSPLVVIGDATQLHQVVMNLCSNAIQATSVGGTLRVALEAVELAAERALSNGTLRPGHYVRLTVEDSGSGMDAATLARIFEPFFTTKETGRGTGLGLSLVYAIVADAGGAIDVRSILEQGSTFTIYLPRAQGTPITGDETTSPLPRGNGERVLLVDDDANLLAITAEALSRLGYEPVSFSDSGAALAAFEAAPRSFDVVVTDDVMPGITGTGLASVLRQQRRELPIVLVSGYSGPILAQRAVAAGVSELLVKPLQSREIAAVLARLLRAAQ